MTTAEPLRSPSFSSSSNGIIPHDNNNGTIVEQVSQPFDSSVFRSYLLSLLPPVLGASLEELESIFDDEFDERVSRFAAEGGVVIYVVKVRDDVEGEYSKLLVN
jgi:dynein heavy chain 1